MDSADSAIALASGSPDNRTGCFAQKINRRKGLSAVIRLLPAPLRCLPVLALAFAAAPMAAEAAVSLATYRAVHDLVLDPSSDTPDLATMNGRLVTEFSGANCSGYSTTTRFVTQAEDGEGESQLADSRSVTFESADGRFDFDNQTFDNGAMSERAHGSAQKSAAGVAVKLTEPGAKSIDLGRDVLFPTEQTVRIIEAAEAGDHFVSFRAYDGLENGEGVTLTTTVIGAVSTEAAGNDREVAAMAKAGFATLRHWPVTISYFDGGNGVDQLPAYSMSAVLYENGIMRALRLDYGKFTLTGTMARLDVLPPRSCP
jgi:hypothetical protein